MPSEVATSCSLRPSVLTAFQNLRLDRTSPLKSVENKGEDKMEKTGGTDHVLNGDCDSAGFNIRNEPFTDFYTVEEQLGRGMFASVKRCQHKTSGAIFAGKFLRKRRKGKNCRDEILQEIKMLDLGKDHARIVNIVEVYENTNELIIVTEYAEGGELFKYVMNEMGCEEHYVIHWMRQILHGLIFLHERNIVHLDVKPQNILLASAPPLADIKICDFGFARTVYSGEDVRDILGTPDYVAPEVLSYEPIHTASDMWSLGVTAYVLLTGSSPFAGDNKMETFSNITQLALDFPDDMFEHVSSDAIDCIKALCKLDASERLTAQECLNHKWLYQEEEEEVCIDSLDSPYGTPCGSPCGSPYGSPLSCPLVRTPSPDMNHELCLMNGENNMADTNTFNPSELLLQDTLQTGSPLSCRRALTPSPNTTHAEKNKRCKCAANTSSSSSNSSSSSLDVDLSNHNHTCSNLCGEEEKPPPPAATTTTGTTTTTTTLIVFSEDVANGNLKRMEHEKENMNHGLRLVNGENNRGDAKSFNPSELLLKKDGLQIKNTNESKTTAATVALVDAH